MPVMHLDGELVVRLVKILTEGEKAEILSDFMKRKHFAAPVAKCINPNCKYDYLKKDSLVHEAYPDNPMSKLLVCNRCVVPLLID